MRGWPPWWVRGLLAGLSDDDPAGITTYSVLGTDYGYTFLWVLAVSTIALVLFQDLGARIGVVTGQGLAGPMRQRYGARAGVLPITALFVANVGTTTAEFAGIAAGGQIFGVPRVISVPVAAVLVSVLVLRGGFRRSNGSCSPWPRCSSPTSEPGRWRGRTGAPRCTGSSCQRCRRAAR